MNREVHVRICERLGVQIPGATRQPQIHAEEEPTGHRASARPYRDWNLGVYSIVKFELTEQGSGTKIVF